MSRHHKHRRSPAPSTVRRLSVPTRFRTDLYLFVIRQPWWISGALVASAFLTVNLGFALLYRLFPGSVSNAVSLSDLFFFSVQTMSTVGYGAMSPVTTAAHILVTCEVAFGIVFVAIMTGFMFAKASRPGQSAIFSRYLVVNNRFGQPHLMCRFGNARGTEIIDARFTLGILTDEITPEGETIRRLTDLHLIRSHTAFFFVTMTLLHPITETSPFFNLSLEELQEKIIAIVATVSGHDVTYGQTVHARHYYSAADIRLNHRFKDAVGRDEDGTIVVDYKEFDETEAN